MIELCTIVSHENRYLPEWVEHHLQWFDKITIYDNNPIHGEYVKDIVNDPRVTVIETHRGLLKQMLPVRNNHVYTCKYAIWLDADEFLETNVEIVQHLDKMTELGFDFMNLNWLCYTGKLANTTSSKVQDRFQTITRPIDGHFGYYQMGNRVVKNIFLTKSNPTWLNAHRPVEHHKHCNDKLEAVECCAYTKDISHTNIYIKHYVTKTLSEYNEKRNRGVLDTPTANHYSQSFFDSYNS